MLAILYKTKGEPWFRLGGMTLLERNLRYLEAEGISRATVILPQGENLPALSVPRPLHLWPNIEYVREGAGELGLEQIFTRIGSSGPDTASDTEPDSGADSCFIYDANTLVDRRALAALKSEKSKSSCLLLNSKKEPLIAYRGAGKSDNPDQSYEQAERISLDKISPYASDIRGNYPVFALKITEESEIENAWDVLIKRQQKRQNDFIEKYTHPHMQNWMVKKVCETAITPNQISLLVIIIAIAAAFLFYHGLYFTAFFAAFAATVLDGVDGKLARVKLMTSKVGKLEHIFDYFYENAWYLCLAANLSTLHGPTAWKLGIAIVVFDTLDKIQTALFQKKAGRTLDEMSPFDEHFRLIGGRRSIYIFILLAHFIILAPYVGLKTVLVWAITTVLIHAARIAWHLNRPKFRT